VRAGFYRTSCALRLCRKYLGQPIDKLVQIFANSTSGTAVELGAHDVVPTLHKAPKVGERALYLLACSSARTHFG
jgi:hypothetical protein